MPIEVPQRDDCPFCRNIAGVESAVAGQTAVVYEDDLTFVFVSPAALGGMEGHLTVIPRRHVEMIFDLHDNEMSALGLRVKRAARAVRHAVDPDGVLVLQRNGVVAEQTVPHVHFHVIPRRGGTPFPPAQWVERTPADERQALAARIRAHW
jgi:histidine triad (HIT) family protein